MECRLNRCGRGGFDRRLAKQEDKDSNPVKRFWRPRALPGASSSEQKMIKQFGGIRTPRLGRHRAACSPLTPRTACGPGWTRTTDHLLVREPPLPLGHGTANAPARIRTWNAAFGGRNEDPFHHQSKSGVAGIRTPISRVQTGHLPVGRRPQLPSVAREGLEPSCSWRRFLRPVCLSSSTTKPCPDLAIGELQTWVSIPATRLMRPS
jgi:hypothetical protein